MKVIVLKISSYKEKDAIVEAVHENGLVTFLARGIKDPKSKNTILNNPLSIVDIDLMDGDFKYPILKSSKEVLIPLKMDMSSSYLGVLMTINEMMVNLFPDEEKHKMYPLLEQAVMALKNSSDYLLTLLIFMSFVIRLGGYDLEVNRCVICGQKNRIVAFSFVDGGFICENCLTEETERDLSKEQMILLRNIFNSRDYHLIGNPYNKDDAIVLVRKFSEFIEEAFGYHFKNLRLILD